MGTISSCHNPGLAGGCSGKEIGEKRENSTLFPLRDLGYLFSFKSLSFPFIKAEQRGRHGGWTGGYKEGGTNWKTEIGIRHATMCKLDSQWEPAIKHRKLSPILCDDLDGWDEAIGRRFRKEGIYVYLRLMHVVVWWKPIQHCKASY